MSRYSSKSATRSIAAGLTRFVLSSAFLFGFVGSAQAIYIDFADYQAAANGNRADIVADGLSLSISANPSQFDLSITDAGLGVACTGRRLRCLGNQSAQIDAEWHESIVITFNDGPIVLQSVDLSLLSRGEIALVRTDSHGVGVRGNQSFWSRNTDRSVDLDGTITTQLVISTWGRFSDASLRGIEFDLVEPVVPIRPDPLVSPVPEPSAALLFAAGLTIIAERAGVSRKRN